MIKFILFYLLILFGSEYYSSVALIQEKEEKNITQTPFETISYFIELRQKRMFDEDTIVQDARVQIVYNPADTITGFDFLIVNKNITALYINQVLHSWFHDIDKFDVMTIYREDDLYHGYFFFILNAIRTGLPEFKKNLEEYYDLQEKDEDPEVLVYVRNAGKDDPILNETLDSLKFTIFFHKDDILPFLEINEYYTTFGLKDHQEFHVSQVVFNEYNHHLPLDPEYWQKKYTGYTTWEESDFNRENLLPVNALSPDWTLYDPDSNPVSFYDQQYQLYLLDFWYMACVPCLQAMPFISEFQEKYGDRGLKIYGINAYDQHQKERMLEIAGRRGLNYQVLFSERSFPYEAYGVRAYPTKYLLDSEKRVIRVFRGFSEESMQELNDLIEELLGEEG